MNFVKAVQSINNKIDISVVAACKLFNFSANTNSNICLDARLWMEKKDEDKMLDIKY